MAKKPEFLDLNTCRPNLKGSFFEKLLPLRKRLFEKYPSANRGLALTGPPLRFGNIDGLRLLGSSSCGTFTFTANEKSDKVEFTGADGVRFCARFKKDVNNFDVSLAGNCNDANKYLVKYEERQQGAPRYVVGWEYLHKPTGFKNVAKFDPATTRVKNTLSFPGGNYGIPKEFRLAADTQFFLNQASKGQGILFNVGVAYDSPIGQTCLAYNQNNEATLTHIKKFNKFQVGLEVGHSVPQLVKRKVSQIPPVVLAASYDIDSKLMVRAKVNHNLDINLGVKKSFSENVDVSIGTFLPGKNLQSMLTQPPSFGFKITLQP